MQWKGKPFLGLRYSFSHRVYDKGNVKLEFAENLQKRTYLERVVFEEK